MIGARRFNYICIIYLLLLTSFYSNAEIVISDVASSISDANTGSADILATSEVPGVDYTIEVFNADGTIATNQAGEPHRYENVDGPLEIKELPAGTLTIKFVDSNDYETIKEVVIEEEGDLCSVLDFAITDRKNVDVCYDFVCTEGLTGSGCVPLNDNGRLCCGLGYLKVEVVAPHDNFRIEWVHGESNTRRSSSEYLNAPPGEYTLNIYTASSEEPCRSEKVVIEACQDFFAEIENNASSCLDQGVNGRSRFSTPLLIAQGPTQESGGTLTIDPSTISGQALYHWEDEMGKVLGSSEILTNLIPGEYCLVVNDPCGDPLRVCKEIMECMDRGPLMLFDYTEVPDESEGCDKSNEVSFNIGYEGLGPVESDYIIRISENNQLIEIVSSTSEFQTTVDNGTYIIEIVDQCDISITQEFSISIILKLERFALQKISILTFFQLAKYQFHAQECF